MTGRTMKRRTFLRRAAATLATLWPPMAGLRATPAEPMATAAAETEVVWEPFPGSQELFLTCPHREVLYTGTRGPGKTDALLMDFARDVGRGLEASWRGVIFRQESTQLEEVRTKANRWFPRIFPGAKYVGQPKDKWVFPNGEELLFRHAKRKADYNKYHGWEVPWIGWEELTNWADPTLYHLFKSINRTTHPDVPLRYRATCNPYGPGHNWVKAYFIDPATAGQAFVPDLDDVADVLSDAGVSVDDEEQWKAVTLHGHYRENRALMATDPNYAATIARAAENPEQAKAWLSDDWDIVSGGMFDDVWSRSDHVLPDFSVPPGWRIYRAFDWGSSKPFSVGWWAEANGEEAELPDGTVFCPPRGSRIRIAEWYGWDGRTPNVGLKMTDREVGLGIKERERAWKIHRRTDPGPADSSIFSADPGNKTPAQAMKAVGIEFVPADKSAGSRIRGWEAIRRMLKEAKKDRPEHPGLWVMAKCRQFIRTIPTLPRSDSNPDDADTDAEDHIGDETRYALDARGPKQVRSEAISI